MCGIVYYHSVGSHGVWKPILKRFNAQKKRGTDGFGFVAFDMNSKKLGKYFLCETEKEVEDALNGLKEVSGRNNGILFHHRFPTSTPNLAECAHPILVSHAELEHDYYVVHNGIIRNDDKLKEEHNAIGYEYTTEIQEIEGYLTRKSAYQKAVKTQFNDSEALAIELARFIEKKADKMEAQGTIAFIALQATKGEKAEIKKLFFGRNYQNPLYKEVHGDSFCLKSEGSQADAVTAHRLFCYDYETGQTTDEPLDIGVNYVSSYNHVGRSFKEDSKDLLDDIGWNYGRRSIDHNERKANDESIKQINDAIERTKQTHKDKEKEKTEGRKVPVIHMEGDVMELREAEEEIESETSRTFNSYFSEPSSLDYVISDLRAEGNSLEDMEDLTLDEIYDLESIIEVEKAHGHTSNVEKLQERLDFANARLTILDNMRKIENGQLDLLAMQEEDDTLDAQMADAQEDHRGMGFRTHLI